MRIARLIALAGAMLAWLALAGAAPTPDAADRCAWLARTDDHGDGLRAHVRGRA